jgi:tetratricopeptide (TPR) repeat protein
MEQTGVIRHEIGEYVLRFPKRPRIPVQQSGTVKRNTEVFYASWEEACRAQYEGEPRRAHYFYHQALKAAPEDVEAEVLADIFDSLKEINRILAQDEGKLPGLRAAVESNSADSETRFRYASLLWKLGYEEEAEKQYGALLEHPEALCQDCWRDCLNNIGWLLYRRKEYAKALPWFERAAKVKSVGPMGDMCQLPLPFENIIQVYVALHRVEEAERAALDYISRFGRLSWPERHALRRLNIDADALYVQSCGHAA